MTGKHLGIAFAVLDNDTLAFELSDTPAGRSPGGANRPFAMARHG